SVAAVVVIIAEIVIGGLPGEEMPDHDEHSVGYRDHRLIVPAVTHDSAVASRPGSTPVTDRAERGFGEGGAQPGVALPDLAAAMSPGHDIRRRIRGHRNGDLICGTVFTSCYGAGALSPVHPASSASIRSF